MCGVRRQPMPVFWAFVLLIAGLDLLVRYGDLLFGFILASVSLGIGVGRLDITQWLLLFAALALVADRFYPPPMREHPPMSERLGKVLVRAITAGAGTGIAIVLTTIDGLDDAGLLVGVVAAFLLTIALVFRSFGVSTFEEDGPFVLGLDWFAPDEGIAQQELTDAKSYEGWRRAFALGIFAVAVHVIIFAPVLVAGVIATMLVETFPLPDLLGIAYMLGAVVAAKIERFPEPPAALNVDDHLLKSAKYATNGMHGIFVVLLFGVGIFMTVATPMLVLRPTTELLFTVFEPPILPVLTWNVVGLWTLSLASALYGLWFWLRMTPRIAAFLERWNDEPRETGLRSRPKSLLVPSLGATVVATAGLGHGFLGPNRHIFAVAWPLTAFGVALVVHRTRQRHPTVARREDFTVVAATLLGYATLMLSLAIGTGDLSVLVSPNVGLLCGIVLYVAGLGRANKYATQHNSQYGSDEDDERRLAFAVYLGVGGLLALLTTGYLEGPVRIFVLVGGVALVLFAIAVGITSYYRA